jgi:hypothetical protein
MNNPYLTLDEIEERVRRQIQADAKNQDHNKAATSKKPKSVTPSVLYPERNVQVVTPRSALPFKATYNMGTDWMTPMPAPTSGTLNGVPLPAHHPQPHSQSSQKAKPVTPPKKNSLKLPPGVTMENFVIFMRDSDYYLPVVGGVLVKNGRDYYYSGEALQAVASLNGLRTDQLVALFPSRFHSEFDRTDTLNREAENQIQWELNTKNRAGFDKGPSMILAGATKAAKGFVAPIGHIAKAALGTAFPTLPSIHKEDIQAYRPIDPNETGSVFKSAYNVLLNLAEGTASPYLDRQNATAQQRLDDDAEAGLNVLLSLGGGKIIDKALGTVIAPLAGILKKYGQEALKKMIGRALSSEGKTLAKDAALLRLNNEEQKALRQATQQTAEHITEIGNAAKASAESGKGSRVGKPNSPASHATSGPDLPVGPHVPSKDSAIPNLDFELSAAQQSAKRHVEGSATYNSSEHFADAAHVGALYLDRGVTSRAAWERAMHADLGPWFSKQANRIWGLAMEIWYKRFLQRAGDVVDARLPDSKLRVKTDGRALQSDLPALSEDPGHAAAVRNEMSGYAGMNKPGFSLENSVDFMGDNLRAILETAPKELIQDARNIPVGNNYIVNQFAKKYRLPKENVAAVLAVLSPQKRWFENVSLAERIIQVYGDAAAEQWTNEMTKTAQSQLAHLWKVDSLGVIKNDLARIQGKAFSELTNSRDKAMWIRIYDQAHNPQSYLEYSSKGKVVSQATKNDGGFRRVGWSRFDDIEKAVKAIEAKNQEDISAALGGGHKVRNFYNNLANPWDKGNFMTVDTHQVAAGLFQPLSGRSLEVQQAFGGGGVGRSTRSGMSGTYGVHVTAGQKVAESFGYRYANELQSAIWRAAQNLFGPAFKTSENQKAIRALWTKYQAGALDRESVISKILDLARASARADG